MFISTIAIKLSLEEQNPLRNISSRGSVRAYIRHDGLLRNSESRFFTF